MLTVKHCQLALKSAGGQINVEKSHSSIDWVCSKRCPLK